MRSIKPDPALSVRRVRIPTESGSIPALILLPKNGAKKATGILWIHGGGYIAGMKEMVHMSRAVDLVKNYGAVVVSPGYRLAFRAPLSCCGGRLLRRAALFEGKCERAGRAERSDHGRR